MTMTSASSLIPEPPEVRRLLLHVRRGREHRLGPRAHRVLIEPVRHDVGLVGEDAVREANLAMVLRPDEATVLYNAACTFGDLGKRAEALDALRKAWEAGFKDADWTRRDPDLAILHGDPEFERLYPAPPKED